MGNLLFSALLVDGRESSWSGRRSAEYRSFLHENIAVKSLEIKVLEC